MNRCLSKAVFLAVVSGAQSRGSGLGQDSGAATVNENNSV